MQGTVPLKTATEIFDRDGRIWFRNAVSKASLMAIESYCLLEGRPGIRLQLTRQRQRLLGPSSEIGKSVGKILPGAFPVRLVAFDKNEEHDWSLPWHQDRVIAVKNKADIAGFRNWSRKAGCWHCEPPISILEKMVFVRVHLDDATADNGPMALSVCSHKHGAVKSEAAAQTAEKLETETCLASTSDLLIVNMLTLHKSIKAVTRTPRRTIRIDYSNTPLPPPLEWAFE